MKGIMFKEELFKKVLSGEKTQTRRIIPMKYAFNRNPDRYNFLGFEEEECKYKGWAVFGDLEDDEHWLFARPRYMEGDVVFLKEPYNPVYNWGSDGEILNIEFVEYRYQGDVIEPDDYWENKMFMPAKCAREFIKITKVRVERIADISDQDSIAEGCPGYKCECPNPTPQYGCTDCYNSGFLETPQGEFRELWDGINLKWNKVDDTYVLLPFWKWSDIPDTMFKNSHKRKEKVIYNPWVFAYDFERCDREGNPILKITDFDKDTYYKEGDGGASFQ